MTESLISPRRLLAGKLGIHTKRQNVGESRLHALNHCALNEVLGGTVLILNPLILFTGDFMFPRCNLALADFVSGQRLRLTHLFDATERL